MYSGLLHAHNGLRWLVLLTLLMAVILSFSGWFGNRKWSKIDNKAGLFLTIFVDLQFLIGIVLYVFVSPLTTHAFSNFGASMKIPEIRFYLVEHIFMMILALVFIHIGRAKSKKAKSVVKQHRSAAIFYSISLLLILLAIPWDRAFV